MLLLLNLLKNKRPRQEPDLEFTAGRRSRDEGLIGLRQRLL